MSKIKQWNWNYLLSNRKLHLTYCAWKKKIDVEYKVSIHQIDILEEEKVY